MRARIALVVVGLLGASDARGDRCPTDVEKRLPACKAAIGSCAWHYDYTLESGTRLTSWCFNSRSDAKRDIAKHKRFAKSYARFFQIPEEKTTYGRPYCGACDGPGTAARKLTKLAIKDQATALTRPIKNELEEALDQLVVAIDQRTLVPAKAVRSYVDQILGMRKRIDALHRRLDVGDLAEQSVEAALRVVQEELAGTSGWRQRGFQQLPAPTRASLLKQDGKIVNGRKSGTWRRWSSSGALLSEMSYRRDLLDGVLFERSSAGGVGACSGGTPCTAHRRHEFTIGRYKRGRLIWKATFAHALTAPYEGANSGVFEQLEREGDSLGRHYRVLVAQMRPLRDLARKSALIALKPSKLKFGRRLAAIKLPKPTTKPKLVKERTVQKSTPRPATNPKQERDAHRARDAATEARSRFNNWWSELPHTTSLSTVKPRTRSEAEESYQTGERALRAADWVASKKAHEEATRLFDELARTAASCLTDCGIKYQRYRRQLRKSRCRSRPTPECYRRAEAIATQQYEGCLRLAHCDDRYR